MTTTNTLYNRLGGAAGISDLVVEFYERVLHDPLLAPAFAHTSMDHLRKMQQEYFSIATGGPSSNAELSLRAAHAGRGISEAQYRRFVDHLLATLEPRGLEPDDIDRMMDRLALERDNIVDHPGNPD